MSIKKDIERAETIEALIDNAYTGPLRSLRVRITKGKAREIVDAAPTCNKPEAKWEGTNLVLVPTVGRA